MRVGYWMEMSSRQRTRIVLRTSPTTLLLPRLCQAHPRLPTFRTTLLLSRLCQAHLRLSTILLPRLYQAHPQLPVSPTSPLLRSLCVLHPQPPLRLYQVQGVNGVDWTTFFPSQARRISYGRLFARKIFTTMQTNRRCMRWPFV